MGSKTLDMSDRSTITPDRSLKSQCLLNSLSKSEFLSIQLINPSDYIYSYLDYWYQDVTVSSIFEFVEGGDELTVELLCRSNDAGEYIFAFDILVPIAITIFLSLFIINFLKF